VQYVSELILLQILLARQKVDWVSAVLDNDDEYLLPIHRRTVLPQTDIFTEHGELGRLSSRLERHQCLLQTEFVRDDLVHSDIPFCRLDGAVVTLSSYLVKISVLEKLTTLSLERQRTQLAQTEVEEFIRPFIAVLCFELGDDLLRGLAVGRVNWHDCDRF